MHESLRLLDDSWTCFSWWSVNAHSRRSHGKSSTHRWLMGVNTHNACSLLGKSPAQLCMEVNAHQVTCGTGLDTMVGIYIAAHSTLLLDKQCLKNMLTNLNTYNLFSISLF